MNKTPQYDNPTVGCYIDESSGSADDCNQRTIEFAQDYGFPVQLFSGYFDGLLNLDIEPKLLREELAEHGAWEDDELLNHEENIRRIIWIAACNIRENEYEASKN